MAGRFSGNQPLNRRLQALATSRKKELRHFKLQKDLKIPRQAAHFPAPTDSSQLRQLPLPFRNQDVRRQPGQTLNANPLGT